MIADKSAFPPSTNAMGNYFFPSVGTAREAE
jgi:hypothetical protein